MIDILLKKGKTISIQHFSIPILLKQSVRIASKKRVSYEKQEQINNTIIGS